ncbi:MAG: hypothetical protein ABIO57_01620 [Candidatus Paceibacterota bacterium]
MKNMSSGKILLWTVIGGFVLGGILSSQYVTWSIFLVGGILAWRKYEEEKGLKVQRSDEVLKSEARNLVEVIKENKSLEKVSSSAFLENGEYPFLEEHTALYETKSITESSGAGVRFRVMRGVSVGGYKGKSESHQEMRELDSGVVTLTNKKIIFRGSKENRTIQLKDIVGLKRYSDAIEIASTGRQKGSSFTVVNPYIWNVLFYVLRNVPNPLDFSGIQNIDISIE